MHIHRQFLQCLAKIILVATKSLNGNTTHGVYNYRIGVTGQQVLTLGIEVPYGNHWLAAFLKRLQRRHYLLGFTYPNRVQMIQLHHQGVDIGVILCRLNRFNYIAEQYFTTGRRRLSQ